MHGLRVVAWELTRRCPLKCRHCRAGGDSHVPADELTRDECFRVIESITRFAKPLLILTGGEPLLREDCFQIAGRARDAGMRVALATCGAGFGPGTATRLVRHGVARISISIDGSSAESHDAFRGVPGSFDAACRAAGYACDAGLDFQINTTVSAINVDELPEVLALARRLGAKAFHVFVLVPTGRGRSLAGRQLTPARYLDVLKWIGAEAAKGDIEIKPTCAPQYAIVAATPSPRGGGGCLGGRSFAFISAEGRVQPCGFLDVRCGDLRAEGLDFERIWDGSEIFEKLRRQSSYTGRCAACAFWASCGGCRARAYEASGNYLAEDPICPLRGDTTAP